VADIATVRGALAAGRVSPRGELLANRLVVEPSKAHGLWLEFVGPASAPADGRYLVTSSAIDVGGRGIHLCVAVDPRDPQGVWWWEPGASGCTTRSTGPTVFHADQAAVSHSAQPKATASSFRLGLISRTPSFLEVRLAIQDGRMRSLDTGAVVALTRRNDLDLPEQPPAPRPH
jgi:hypothetical protein